MRFFATEGPVDCARHYCLPPLTRFDLEDVLLLIEQQRYVLLHAPRQTGKTSCLLALAEHLNRAGRYRAVYANIEGAQAYREDVDRGMAAVVEQIARGARDQIAESDATKAQTADYADRCGAQEAHLLIFDRRPAIAWEENVWQREEVHGGQSIGVWGL